MMIGKLIYIQVSFNQSNYYYLVKVKNIDWYGVFGSFKVVGERETLWQKRGAFNFNNIQKLVVICD